MVESYQTVGKEKRSVNLTDKFTPKQQKPGGKLPVLFVRIQEPLPECTLILNLYTICIYVGACHRQTKTFPIIQINFDNP